MNGKKMDISGVPETMLQTLYARAAETMKDDPVIRDEEAVRMVSMMDYDFSDAGRDRAMSTGVIARTIVLDRLTGDFLRENEDAVVVNIACGLDTRCRRMEGRYRRWYNIDLPGTMDIRRRFLMEEGPVYQIVSSAMDPAWADEVEQDGEPVLVIMEGLTMYLDEEAVRTIFHIIGERFPKVCVMAEIMNPWVVSHVKEKSIEGSSAKFTWGVRSGKELESLAESFESTGDVSLTEGMKVFMPVYRILGKIGFVRNISNKICVMRK